MLYVYIHIQYIAKKFLRRSFIRVLNVFSGGSRHVSGQVLCILLALRKKEQSLRQTIKVLPFGFARFIRHLKSYVKL